MALFAFFRNADFNSHAHVERDERVFKMTFEQMNFNSHAHVERDETAETIREYYSDFNSHAHVERDKPCTSDESAGEISTHTLTWSVTRTG